MGAISLIEFDPDNVSKDLCNKLASHLENYVSLLEEVMIFPKEMKEKDKMKMKDAVKTTKKLIKKLRKGDTSVFKDVNEINEMF